MNNNFIFVPYSLGQMYFSVSWQMSVIQHHVLPNIVAFVFLT